MDSPFMALGNFALGRLFKPEMHLLALLPIGQFWYKLFVFMITVNDHLNSNGQQ